MYEGLIKALNQLFIESRKAINVMNGKDNILSDGNIKLVSGGNIVFDGVYMNAEILEKKKNPTPAL